MIQREEPQKDSQHEQNKIQSVSHEKLKHQS